MSGYDETGKFCMGCQKPVIAKRKATNHLLHFLVTVCTCFWGFVWIWLSIKFGGWHCSICGSKALR